MAANNAAAFAILGIDPTPALSWKPRATARGFIASDNTTAAADH
jgi:hypothetical protein